MAVLGPLLNAKVTVNGVDLSDHVSAVSIETSRDDVDITAMGAVNKVTMPSLGDATITVTFFQDFAAAKVDQTLWPLSTTSTPFTVAVLPVNAAKSTTNPEYSMSALMYGYSPISGGIGDALTTDVEFRNASQAGLARATA
jgi:hypothetical protein